MTSRDDDLTDGRLDALLERLRGVGAQRDPVPPSVHEHAMAALELRDLDTELAALVADSFEVDAGLALVRGPGSTRLLTFEARGVVVELQVTSMGSQRRLEGQVAGVGNCDLSLQDPQGIRPISPDEHGRFRVDAVPAGRLRLSLRDENRAVTTTWVDV